MSCSPELVFSAGWCSAIASWLPPPSAHLLLWRAPAGRASSRRCRDGGVIAPAVAGVAAAAVHHSQTSVYPVTSEREEFHWAAPPGGRGWAGGAARRRRKRTTGASLAAAAAGRLGPETAGRAPPAQWGRAAADRAARGAPTSPPPGPARQERAGTDPGRAKEWSGRAHTCAALLPAGFAGQGEVAVITPGSHWPDLPAYSCYPWISRWHF